MNKELEVVPESEFDEYPDPFDEVFGG